MKLIKLSLIASIVLFNIGCSMLEKNAARLNVTSNPPGAKVFLLDRSGTPTELGETPLRLDDKTISSRQTTLFNIKFEKAGYIPEIIRLEGHAKTLAGEIDVKLTPEANWDKVLTDKTARHYLEDVAQKTAKIQGAVAAGEFNKGQDLALAFTSKYPNLVVGWNLLGNIYYMQKRRGEAIQAYNKALTLDPNNQEIKNILASVR